MTYEFWLQAENFLYTQLFVRSLILGFIFLALFHIFLYRGFNNNKKFYIIFSTILILTIGVTVKTAIDYNEYKELYDYEKYVNYGMRNNKKGIIGYNQAPYFERTAYNQLYLLDNFRKVGLYEEEMLEQEVDFLGRKGDNFYFADRKAINFRELGDQLEISEDIGKPIRVGAKFELKNKKFKEIGFKEESPYTYLITYKIPKSMENKKFENPENIETIKQEELLYGWVNSTFRNRLSQPNEE